MKLAMGVLLLLMVPVTFSPYAALLAQEAPKEAPEPRAVAPPEAHPSAGGTVMLWWPLIGVILLALLVAGAIFVIRFGWYGQALLIIALLTAAVSSILGIDRLSDSNQARHTPGAILLAAGVIAFSVSAVAAAVMMPKRHLPPFGGGADIHEPRTKEFNEPKQV